MKLFFEIKNQPHDASGVIRPQTYYWEKTNGIYFPVRQMTEDEMHELVREFINDNDNLPQKSLDEIKLKDFTPSQLKYREFLLSLFNL